MQALMRYPFPGNVRELENLLHRAVALSNVHHPRSRRPGHRRASDCRTRRPAAAAIDFEPTGKLPGRVRACRGHRPAHDTRPPALGSGHTSTRSSATSWCGRWRNTATTAPQQAPAWACRCARCATAWPAWAYRSPIKVWCWANASIPMSIESKSLWENGWLCDARTVPSPNFGPRPDNTAITLAVIHSISLPPGVIRWT